MNEEAQKELSRKEYWDERYAKEREQQDASAATYEWFKTFDKLRPFLAKHLPEVSTVPRVLHLGCGTSSLSADLYGLGYADQLSIDFSDIAIDEMKQKYASLHLEWEVMDVRRMSIPSSSIDVALDKGTLDAMLHGSLWDPEDDVRENVGAYIDEVARVVKPGGRFLYISYRQPHFLKPLLSRPDVWHLQVETLADDPGSFEYFGFIMDKHVSAA